MSKLSETTRSFRKYVIGFLIFALVVIIIQNLYSYFTSKDEDGSQTSSDYAYVTEGFGDITYPEIPSLAIAEGSKPAFSISGRFDKSPTSVNVYKVDKPRETLGNSKNAQEIAENLNFSPEDYELSGNILSWRSNDKQRLEYNKLTNDISYINEGINIEKLRKEKPEFLNTEGIDSTLNNYLSKFNTSLSLMEENQTQKSYLLAVGNSFQTTNITENADFIRADYFQSEEIVSLRSTALEKEGTQTEPINGLIYFDDPKEGSVYLVISNLSDTAQNSEETNESIRLFNMTQIDVSEEKSVYKLKTFEEAWEDIQDGKGSLKYLVRQSDDPFKDYTPLDVKRFIADPDKSKLAYYAPKSWTGYLYPIYLFEGIAEISDGTTADFIFYTKAID